MCLKLLLFWKKWVYLIIIVGFLVKMVRCFVVISSFLWVLAVLFWILYV